MMYIQEMFYISLDAFAPALLKPKHHIKSVMLNQLRRTHITTPSKWLRGLFGDVERLLWQLEKEVVSERK